MRLAGLCGWLFSVAPAEAASASESKISEHLLVRYTTGGQQILQAHPRILKVIDITGPMMQAVREYKSGTPQGMVVLRIYTTKGYSSNDDPAASGTNFWNTVLWPALSILSAADRALIDYVEGPNECDNGIPCWGTVQGAQWQNAFWVALAPLIRQAGPRPCAFSISVGNPPGTINEVYQKLDAIVPALRTCLTNGGAWSYHAYTQPYSKELGSEIWYSLRYRQYYSYFASRYPDLLNLPIIFTEAGVDNGKGWNDPTNGDAAKFQDWLPWWDQQIRQDPYVLGATLFQIGQPEVWTSWDLEPIAPWLSSYIALNRTNSPIIALETNVLALTLPQGSNGMATVNLRNAGVGTLTYSVSDNASWLSVSPTTGSSTGETNTLTLNLNSSALLAGLHSATVTLTAPNANAQSLALNLRIASTNTLVALTSAIAVTDSNTVLVTFAEGVRPSSATNTAHYSLHQTLAGAPLTVLAARLRDASSVLLSTAPQTPGLDYTLTVSNVTPAAMLTPINGRNGQTNLIVHLPLINLDAVTLWKYNQQGIDLGVAWRGTNYTDGGWPSGPALLAYETGALPEPIRTTLTTNTAKPTFYFRRRFAWPGNTASPRLQLRTVIDDGAVLHLNGTEIHRLGITNNPVNFGSFASRTVDNAAYEGPFDLNVTNLVTGLNVLAAEVHQVNATSSDIAFGLSLETWLRPSQIAGALPLLQIQRHGDSIVLSWTGTGFTLQWAPEVDGAWTSLTGLSSPLTNSLPATNRFFRLVR